MWLVVEGLDGSGKTTLLENLKAYYESQGRKVEIVREPGSTPVGEVIRPLLKEGQFQTPLGELLGFCACRAELVATRVKDLLAQGVVVLMDRFYPTTIAFQGYAMDPTLVPLIYAITRATLKERKPFAILFLNTPPDVCFERCKARGDLDGIESRGLEFFQKAYAGYLQITAGPDYITLDGLQDPETIANQAIDAVALQWGTRIH